MLLPEDETPAKLENTPFAVVLSSADIGWPLTKSILKGINTKVLKGSLTIVSGDIGVGKSTFLEAIAAGSAKIHAGSCAVAGRTEGTLAYGPQRLSFIDDTIRKNVVFGDEYVDVRALEIALQVSKAAIFTYSCTPATKHDSHTTITRSSLACQTT